MTYKLCEQQQILMSRSAGRKLEAGTSGNARHPVSGALSQKLRSVGSPRKGMSRSSSSPAQPSLRVGVAEAGGVAVTSMQLLSAPEQVLVFWLVGVARTPQVSGTPSTEFWSQL